jgi:uncharacterized protein
LLQLGDDLLSAWHADLRRTEGVVMPELPARPDLDQLRRQAKDLLRAAKRGDAAALARMGAVSKRLSLDAAQLALAREHGFASWARLKTEVERHAILDRRDVPRLVALLTEDPALATARMEHWCAHPKGASPLGYVAMLRYDPSRDAWRDLSGTGAVARALLDAGAPVDGDPEEPETPLITAASYGDAEVAQVLIEAGADLEATAAADAGGIPGGTALLHAAVFGMTGVVDVLVAAGARVHSLEEAAAAGDVGGWLTAEAPLEARIRALVMAADHQRLTVSTSSSPLTPRSMRSIRSGAGTRCGPLPATAGRPASATCSPTGQTRTCGMPSTTARRWTGAGTLVRPATVPDISRSRRCLQRSPRPTCQRAPNHHHRDRPHSVHAAAGSPTSRFGHVGNRAALACCC